MQFYDHDAHAEFAPDIGEYKDLHPLFSSVEEWLKRGDMEREQTDIPPVWKWTTPRSWTMRLEKVNRGRCAFCEEQRGDLMPYRFRPPAFAEPPLPPVRKGSYLWLSFAWSNFFAICPDCRPSRPNYFPIRDNVRAGVNDPRHDPGLMLGEKPRLLHPGEREEPLARMYFDGILRVRASRAADTIEHFQLNRDALANARADLAAATADQLVAVSREKDRSRFFLSLEDRIRFEPLGGALYQFLCTLTFELHEVIRDHPRKARPRSIAAMMALLDRQLRDPDFEQHLETAHERMQQRAQSARSPRDYGRLSEVKKPDSRFIPVDLGPREKVFSRFTAQAALNAIDEQPRIKSVRLTNYKSIEEIDFTMEGELPEKLRERLRRRVIQTTRRTASIPKAPCVMMLGENSTGKSSVLEGIALALSRADEVRKLGLDGRKLSLNPEYLGAADMPAPRNCAIDVELHDGSTYKCQIDPETGTIKQTRIGGGGNQDRDLLIFAYGAHRLFGRKTEPQVAGKIGTLFNDSLQVPNPEPWLKQILKENPDQLNEVASALRNIIQIDGEFRTIVLSDDGENCLLEMVRNRRVGDAIEERVVRQPLGIVSSGYRAVLALVCDILRGMFEAYPDAAPHDVRSANAIVMIDEIEAHLHPRWKLRIMSGLRAALPGVTFIVTSHDPLCVRGMFNGEVMALNRYENMAEGARELPEKVEKVSEFDAVEQMTVDQLLTSDLFQLFSTEDESTEDGFAQVADILSKAEVEELRPDERDTLERFKDAIADGLPVGTQIVTQVVQEAVAEFLAARKTMNTRTVSEARSKAKDAVKAFLEGLVR